jgi:Zn-dependent metalloprotease
VATVRKTCTCFFVQPAVLEHIVRTGTPEQRDIALETLGRDHSIRTVRLQNALLSDFYQLRSRSLVEPTPGTIKRVIFDAEQSENAETTKVVWNEGDKRVADPAVNEAADGLGATFRLYWEIYRRNSIDDRGRNLNAVVHYGKKYDNAFWNGSRMVFGDGDGEFLTRTTQGVDVIGHELTHAVTESTANLAYTGQSGALNESISDVFGSLVKQYAAGQTADKADWLIGDKIVGKALKGKALRSMAKPGTAFEGDNQPAHMDHYVKTTADSGGVHTNSGIPNCAFYHVAMAIGGKAWEKAGLIWYDSLRDPRLTPDSNFQRFAQLTLRAAQHHFGAGAESKAVTEAWKAVGIVLT